MFFRPKPNVPDAEKARIEFHLQQIAECVGFDRFRLPILNRESLLGVYQSNPSPDQVVRFVGDHLAHDVGGLRIEVVPKQPASCGSG